MYTTLTANDGHTFQCWIEPAIGDLKGNLIILQEIFGVTDQLIGVAKRYAQQGFKVAIPALFDRLQANTVVPFDQPRIGLSIAGQAQLEHTLVDIDACRLHLAKNGANMAVLGFCWGGGLTLKCAQSLPISAAVIFYGTQLPNYLTDPVLVPVQAHFGRLDNHTPKAMVESVAQRYPEIDIHWYEAGHAFVNDARQTYVADAAALAHARCGEFLAKHITG